VLDELVVGQERRTDVPDAFPECRRTLGARTRVAARGRRIGNVGLEEVSRHASRIASDKTRGNVETPGLCYARPASFRASSVRERTSSFR